MEATKRILKPTAKKSRKKMIKLKAVEMLENMADGVDRGLLDMRQVSEMTHAIKDILEL